MKTTRQTAGSIFAACFFFFSTPVFAQERQGAEDTEVGYVQEGEKWTQEAFNARMSESAAYPGWLNRAGRLDRDDFNSQIFRRWDTDRDGHLDYEEYAAGNIRWAEEFGDNFEAYDLDEDEQISAEEFGAGMDDTGIYDIWDTSGEGYLSEEEFGEGLFNILDADEDGYLSEDEFGETDYDTWFESDVEGGATGTEMEGGTDIETGTGTDTDFGTGTDTGGDIDY
jgi:Ca2+-binding EF-hand superfamily protein